MFCNDYIVECGDYIVERGDYIVESGEDIHSSDFSDASFEKTDHCNPEIDDNKSNLNLENVSPVTYDDYIVEAGDTSDCLSPGNFDLEDELYSLDVKPRTKTIDYFLECNNTVNKCKSEKEDFEFVEIAVKKENDTNIQTQNLYVDSKALVQNCTENLSLHSEIEVKNDVDNLCNDSEMQIENCRDDIFDDVITAQSYTEELCSGSNLDVQNNTENALNTQSCPRNSYNIDVQTQNHPENVFTVNGGPVQNYLLNLYNNGSRQVQNYPQNLYHSNNVLVQNHSPFNVQNANVCRNYTPETSQFVIVVHNNNMQTGASNNSITAQTNQSVTFRKLLPKTGEIPTEQYGNHSVHNETLKNTIHQLIDQLIIIQNNNTQTDAKQKNVTKKNQPKINIRNVAPKKLLPKASNAVLETNNTENYSEICTTQNNKIQNDDTQNNITKTNQLPTKISTPKINIEPKKTLAKPVNVVKEANNTENCSKFSKSLTNTGQIKEVPVDSNIHIKVPSTSDVKTNQNCNKNVDTSKNISQISSDSQVITNKEAGKYIVEDEVASLAKEIGIVFENNVNSKVVNRQKDEVESLAKEIGIEIEVSSDEGNLCLKLKTYYCLSNKCAEF